MQTTQQHTCGLGAGSSRLFVRQPLRTRSHAWRRHCGTRAALAQETKQLTKQDLVDYIASGIKPRTDWRIGTEHEKLGFYLDSNARIDYATIARLLEGLRDRFGWREMGEAGRIIGVEKDGQSVTLEPGGQFELSGAPVETLHMTCSEVNSHLYQVKTISQELGVGFLGLGFDPRSVHGEVPVMPKSRYEIMRNYMPTRGSLGLDMMFRSCTIQVNLDFDSEADMVQKLRIGIALQPISTALFANSPFKEGKRTGYLSWRSHVWTDVDPDRCGTLPFVFDDDFGFDRYVEYALDVPMYFVYRDGKYINAAGQSFRDFMAGRLPACPGERPTLKDWESHLTTIFPEVRLKRYIEMRGADGGPWRNICALPALWVGLLYDERAQAEAVELISSWSLDDMQYMRDEVPRLALQTPFRGGTLQDVAQQVLQISRAGLQRRHKEEESFLDTLDAIAGSGVTSAEKLLQLYEGEWGGSVEPIYSTDLQY